MIVRTKLGYVFLYNTDETIPVLRNGICVSLPVSEMRKSDVMLLKRVDDGIDTVSEKYAEYLGRSYSSKIKVFDSEKNPAYSFICRVDNQDDLNELSDCVGQRLTKNTKIIHYPLKETLRSQPGTARIKVKGRAVMILFGGKFLADIDLDFKKGVKVGFDPESMTLKIGMNEGSEVKATSLNSQQCIYIGRVLKSYGFQIHNTFNIPFEVGEDKTISVRLENHLHSINSQLKKFVEDEIPESIIKGSQKIVRPFLRTLFEREFDSELNFRCSSPLLLHQIRFLLYKLNIVTKLDQKPHIGEAGFWDVRQAKIIKSEPYGDYHKDSCDQIIDKDFSHDIINFNRMYHSILVVYSELQNNFDIFDELDKANKAKFCLKKRVYGWTDEWVEMPEYVHIKKEPYAEVTVKFCHEATFIELSKRLKQKITSKTRSVWFPERTKAGYGHLRWKSES